MWPVTLIRTAIIFVILFFIPGYALASILFKKDEIKFLERITLSLLLSIATITLTLIILNYKFGVRINTLNTLIIVALITGVSTLYKRYYEHI